MDIRKIGLAIISTVICSTTFAAPHFYLQIANRSDKDATISFQEDQGKVHLSPTLANDTPISAHAVTEKYGVYIDKLEPPVSFNIVYTGNQSCTFNIAYYAPGIPQVQISGSGCYGGGYELVDNGHTMLVYISDILRKSA